MTDMSDKCPKCGAESFGGRAAGVFKCGRKLWPEDNPETIDCLRRQLSTLQAIVDKLPKTADGVPVVPGMTLWYWSKKHGPQRLEAVMRTTDGCNDFDLNIESFLHSTREAAEAAQEK
jgi:hypothetical protein